MKLWNFLNGKKTMIGAGFLFASVTLDHLIGEWGITAAWVTHLSNDFSWFGLGLTGGGFIHKGVKLFQNKQQ